MTKKEMKTLSNGDLIYVPSNVTLFKFNKSEKWGDIPYINRTAETKAPITTAFLARCDNFKDDNLCEVVYNGERWGIDLKDVFLLGECHD